MSDSVIRRRSLRAAANATTLQPWREGSRDEEGWLRAAARFSRRGVAPHNLCSALTRLTLRC